MVRLIAFGIFITLIAIGLKSLSLSSVLDNPLSLYYTFRGDLDRENGRLIEAEASLLKAIALNGQNFKAHTSLGIVYRKRGMYEKAINNYRKAIEINPNYAPAYTSIGVIELIRSNKSSALKFMLKAYDLDNCNPTITANLAVAYHYNGNFKLRDKFASKAEQAGYKDMPKIDRIFKGEFKIPKLELSKP
jgi:Flp pilus assembly protein TadD